mmetsp:Transcript_22191/g.56998  ORF Transcript_22191/g.56998 Transcript_22191/m.56998 type:complete len:200 (-) Transcript_22191:276-875(-)
MSPAWSWGAVQCGCATDACHARRVSARTGCTCLTTPPLWRWPDLALAPQTRSVRCSGLHLARGTCPVTAALTRRLAMTTAAALAPTWRPPARGPRRDHGALGWRAARADNTKLLPIRTWMQQHMRKCIRRSASCMTYSPSGTSLTRLAASESSSSALCTLVVTQPAATTLKARQRNSQLVNAVISELGTDGDSRPSSGV